MTEQLHFLFHFFNGGSYTGFIFQSGFTEPKVTMFANPPFTAGKYNIARALITTWITTKGCLIARSLNWSGVISLLPYFCKVCIIYSFSNQWSLILETRQGFCTLLGIMVSCNELQRETSLGVLQRPGETCKLYHY